MGFGYTGGLVHARLNKENTTGNFDYGKGTTKKSKAIKKRHRWGFGDGFLLVFSLFNLS
jgi:hypothetical protein